MTRLVYAPLRGEKKIRALRFASGEMGSTLEGDLIGQDAWDSFVRGQAGLPRLPNFANSRRPSVKPLQFSSPLLFGI
jgi:hypothetical protein